MGEDMCEHCEYCGRWTVMYPYDEAKGLVVCTECDTVYRLDGEGNLHEIEGVIT